MQSKFEKPYQYHELKTCFATELFAIKMVAYFDKPNISLKDEV